MRLKTVLNVKILWFLGILVAGLCLFRVLTVSADEHVEVYSAMDEPVQATDQTATAVDNSDSNSDSNAIGVPDVRLTTPSEAAAGVADQSYDLVPGAAKWMKKNPNAISVPRQMGRSIASEAQLPVGPIPVRQGYRSIASSNEGQESMNPGVMEPLQAPSQPQSYGESYGHEDYYQRAPAAQAAAPAIAPPLPLESVTSRYGEQRVSVIVSDYGFFPKHIFVTQNIPVKLYLTTPGKTTLCFMLDKWGLKRGVAPGKVENLTFTPQEPGDYRFYCPVKSIQGMLTVRAAPLAEPNSSSFSRGVASLRHR